MSLTAHPYTTVPGQSLTYCRHSMHTAHKKAWQQSDYLCPWDLKGGGISDDKIHICINTGHLCTSGVPGWTPQQAFLMLTC